MLYLFSLSRWSHCAGSVRPESPTQFPPIPDFLVPATSSLSPGPSPALHECPPPMNLTELAVEEAPEDVARPASGVTPGAAVEVVDGKEVAASDTNHNTVDDDSGLLQGFSANHFFRCVMTILIPPRSGRVQKSQGRKKTRNF